MLIFPIQSKDLGVMHPIGFQSSYELFSYARLISLLSLRKGYLHLFFSSLVSERRGAEPEN